VCTESSAFSKREIEHKNFKTAAQKPLPALQNLNLQIFYFLFFLLIFVFIPFLTCFVSVLFLRNWLERPFPELERISELERNHQVARAHFLQTVAQELLHCRKQ
jgi:hypothetical protein